MAHFAQIKDNLVINVIVIANEAIIDENGIEQESMGIELCKSLYGEDTQWVQTSYNNNFRGMYAGGPVYYDSVADEFKLQLTEPTE
jgi:hypothetical protein